MSRAGAFDCVRVGRKVDKCFRTVAYIDITSYKIQSGEDYSSPLCIELYQLTNGRVPFLF